jgi:hypothetical protein
MSTHGAVAWKVSTFVIGVYNHSDSYPTHLGKRIWTHIKELGASGLVSRLRQYGDWEEFENCGVCQECGKVAGQPYNITYAIIDGKEVKQHEHGKSDGDQLEPFKRGMQLEWVYVIDVNFNMLEVWVSIREDEAYRYRGMGMIISDELDSHGYTHVLLKTISLEDAEPNWVYLEHETKLLKRGTDDGF